MPGLRHPHGEPTRLSDKSVTMTQHFSLYPRPRRCVKIWSSSDEFMASIIRSAPPRAAIERLVLRAGSADSRRAFRRVETAAGAWRFARCRALSCCCWTNQPRVSIQRRGAGSGTRSIRLLRDGLTVLVSTHYMDEAERCHEIAYIAFGELLARGTVDEVISSSHLTTYVVSSPRGEELADLTAELSAQAGHRYGCAVLAPACTSPAAMRPP